MRTLLWFRGKDLRARDHPALHSACAGSRELIPVFVLSPRYFGPKARVAELHRLQFMLDALVDLARSLEARGSQLQIVDGPASVVIPKIAEQCRVERVLAMESCEPASRRRDARIAERLRVPFLRCHGETLLAPGSVRTKSGGPYQVYTAFARAAAQRLTAAEGVVSTPRRLPPLPARLGLKVRTLPDFAELGLTPNERVQPGGERAAQARLRAFLAGPFASYDRDRDRMDLAGTSRLSADLRFGCLSARDVWQQVRGRGEPAPALERYCAELLWREFAHHLLWERPKLLSEPFRDDYRGFPWQRDDAGFEAWSRGQTGYPIVDASARQLLQEGFVHNRARMIAASFLSKHLLVSYRRGEAHYLRQLTDGDLAQNSLGWQWSAGCGCDAQPYFRVFNPVTQGERFDPDGAYVRRYVPELAQLPVRYVHAPWLAPEGVLRRAGVTLARDYPAPIVEHASARQRFLLLASEHLRGA